jgi:hypothetical protein
MLLFHSPTLGERLTLTSTRSSLTLGRGGRGIRGAAPDQAQRCTDQPVIKKETDMAGADRPAPATHAARVVRRALLRQSIAIDADTAQALVDMVRTVLLTELSPRPARRKPASSDAGSEPLF